MNARYLSTRIIGVSLRGGGNRRRKRKLENETGLGKKETETKLGKKGDIEHLDTAYE